MREVEADLEAMVAVLQQKAVSLGTAVAECDANVTSAKIRVDQLEGQLKEASDARNATETQVHALAPKFEQHQDNELGRMDAVPPDPSSNQTYVNVHHAYSDHVSLNEMICSGWGRPRPPKVAVCLGGTARTFAHQLVLRSLKENVSSSVLTVQ